MAKWDDEYYKLVREILENGVEVENRTGINTIKIPFWHFSLDVAEEFPVLTLKQLFMRQAVLEILWIYQAQSNDVRWLQERNVHIWDEWEIDEGGGWKNSEGQVLKQFDPAFAHTIGTAYGYVVRKYHLMDKLIRSLKEDPNDRRRVISLWQEAELDTAVLPSCVWSSEWDVTDGKLNVLVHQRSCDTALGLPFNVTQYAVLMKMIAQVCGLEAGRLDWSIKDAHIYVNHVEGMKKLMERYETQEPLPAPQLWLNPDVKDFYAFDSSRECKDVRLENYHHMGRLSFDIVQ